MKEYVIKKGIPYPLGAMVSPKGVNFSMVNTSKRPCGVVIYNRKTNEETKIPFQDEHRIGNICCFFVEGVLAGACEYNFYEIDEVFVDPYAKLVTGNDTWGKGKDTQLALRSGFYRSKYDWSMDESPRRSYEDSVFYCLHVRSFTKHKSSHVRHKGTFMGIVEKIPYLKELGITTVELMPAYEFEEYEVGQDRLSIDYQVKHIADFLPDNKADKNSQVEKKCNYWGFKKAYYMAPKAGFCASSDPAGEFKNLVRELHDADMELCMQFYFPDDCKQGYILEILKHWVLEYHVDGFHLLGKNIPVTLLSTDPLFANVKLMYHDFPIDEIYEPMEMPSYKNLGYYRNEFMTDCRRFLKGDSDMLKGFIFHIKNHNDKCGVINYVASYEGFSMMDMVSYDRKHNEDNGENNNDGTEYNYSWNCGVEGPTKKKQILNLRTKQLKNAFTILMTAQGTPMIMAGDEFGFSKKGNNNSYCQDNDTNFIDWNLIKKNNEVYEYVKDLIAFRKANKILHKDTMLSTMDRYGSGYPEISFHSEEAWKSGTENYLRHIGAMMYSRPIKEQTDDIIFTAYNMHWEVKVFDIPKLPKNYKWEIEFRSDDEADLRETKDKHTLLKVPPRSTVILKALYIA